MTDETSAPPLTQTTLEVKVRNETFVFRIPSPRDLARLGGRAQAMRMQDSPETGGDERGLDGFSQNLYRGMALFETLLEKADAEENWPFTGQDGNPVKVDSTKFPPRKTAVITEVYRGFERALDTFLTPGA